MGDRSASESGRTYRTIQVLLAVLAGALIAAAAVGLLKILGVGTQVQRVTAFICVGGPLLWLAERRGIGPEDPLSRVATLIAVSALAVAALTYVGSVDKDAAFGCINTNGPLDETISGETAVVYSQATPASEARRLLLRGCVVRGVAWCSGAVHQDAIEKRVFDARWLVLSGGQGMVPVGRTVGEPLPEDERDDACEGAIPPPRELALSSAVVDRSSGVLGLTARTKGAAFVGFAIRRSDRRWQRLGWDYEAQDDLPVVLPAPSPPALSGTEVTAVACLGYRQPAIHDEKVVAQAGTLSPGRGLRTDRPTAMQPVKATPEAAACDSAVPTPTLPYAQGTVPADR